MRDYVASSTSVVVQCSQGLRHFLLSVSRVTCVRRTSISTDKRANFSVSSSLSRLLQAPAARGASCRLYTIYDISLEDGNQERVRSRERERERERERDGLIKFSCLHLMQLSPWYDGATATVLCKPAPSTQSFVLVCTLCEETNAPHAPKAPLYRIFSHSNTHGYIWYIIYFSSAPCSRTSNISSTHF